MVARLGDTVSFYKIGYQLGFAGGLAFAQELIDAGKQVFVDLKLHDIGNTVGAGRRKAWRGSAPLSSPCMPIRRPCRPRSRRARASLRILAVTVLTSSDDADLVAAGYAAPVAELVARRAAQARDIGVDGLVCSPEEVANVRAIVGPKMALVTPGHPARRQPTPASKSASRRRPPRSLPAPIIWWSAGRSSPPPIRRPRPRRSSPKSRHARRNMKV